MIYKSIQNAEFKTCRYGIEEIPDWLRPYAKGEQRLETGSNVIKCILIITQPEDNKDLACGIEIVNVGDFVIKTKGGSFQVYTLENFFRLFIDKFPES